MVTITLYAKQKKRHRCTEQTFRLWEKARVGCSERTASKQVYYQGWNRSPAQVGCIRQTLRAWCTGKTQRDGMGREVGGAIGMGNTCKSMADACQCMAKNHYNIVISLQLIKINGKKKKSLEPHPEARVNENSSQYPNKIFNCKITSSYWLIFLTSIFIVINYLPKTI